MNTQTDVKETFKAIMGSYPTGVTVVTTTTESGKPVGLTVNSFASVSMDPTLVLFCVDQKAGTLQAFKESQKFAVHVLNEDQKAECFKFAGKDDDKFSDFDWGMTEMGLPVFANAAGVMECKTVREVEAGDHTIFIGEVVSISKSDKEPMLYFRRKVGGVPQDWVEANS